jgi:hypothetical protein
VLGPQLVLGGREPLPDYLRRFRPAFGKPTHKLVPGRRCEKDQQCAGHGGAHLPGAHDINFKQTRQANGKPFRYRRPWRPVVIAGITCPFEKLAAGGHFLELVLGDKEILPAMDLARPRRTRGYRD